MVRRIRWALRSAGRALLTDLAIFEDLVKHVGEGGGAAAGGVLRVFEIAGEIGDLIVALTGGAELVGDIERGENGHAETVDGVALRGDGAHLRVDDGSEGLDVGRIGAAEVIDLVVDIYCDGLALVGGLGGFESLVHRVSFDLFRGVRRSAGASFLREREPARAL